MSDPYPYLVVRYLPGVYSQLPIAFGAASSTWCLSVPGCRPGNPELLDIGERQAVVDAVLDHVKKTRFRCCVVFGPNDAIFVELDGTVNPSATPPSGGVRLSEHAIEVLRRNPVGEA